MKSLNKRLTAIFCAGVVFVSCLGIGGCVDVEQQPEQKPQPETAEIITASAMSKYDQRHFFTDDEKQAEINRAL